MGTIASGALAIAMIAVFLLTAGGIWLIMRRGHDLDRVLRVLENSLRLVPA